MVKSRKVYEGNRSIWNRYLRSWRAALKKNPRQDMVFFFKKKSNGWIFLLENRKNKIYEASHKQSITKWERVTTHLMRVYSVNLAKLFKRPLRPSDKRCGTSKLFDFCNRCLCRFLVCHCTHNIKKSIYKHTEGFLSLQTGLFTDLTVSNKSWQACLNIFKPRFLFLTHLLQEWPQPILGNCKIK